MLNTEVRKQLNNLIKMNIDSGEGYRFAASAVSDADLQKIFNTNSATRETFAKQLQSVVAQYGEEPADEGSVKAVLHRTWLTFKADLTTKNEVAVVEECIRGDEEAVELYEEVTKDAEFSQTITILVDKQYKAIKETLRQLNEWKKIFEGKTVKA
jgi:uncharacterized protein (TIGR02284 family)